MLFLFTSFEAPENGRVTAENDSDNAINETSLVMNIVRLLFTAISERKSQHHNIKTEGNLSETHQNSSILPNQEASKTVREDCLLAKASSVLARKKTSDFTLLPPRFITLSLHLTCMTHGSGISCDIIGSNEQNFTKRKHCSKIKRKV